MAIAHHICSHCYPEGQGRQTREATFRVLYVGGDAESLVALRHALGTEEFQVVGCSERSGAVMFLKSEIQYDVLMFYVEWQGNEGLKLARLAHSLRHRKQTPMILVAATDTAAEVATFARKVGAKELVKTPDMVAVTDAIKLCLIDGWELRAEVKPN
jgi:response regulator RpfG family c-di-GMP phosphodiesterase